MAIFDIDGSIARYEFLAVDQLFKRIGIGKQLSHAVFNYVKNRGCKEIIVQTPEINRAGWSFLESLGFRKIAEQNVFHFWI